MFCAIYFNSARINKLKAIFKQHVLKQDIQDERFDDENSKRDLFCMVVCH